jgi:uncharacterized protein (TIGR00290 family)
MSVHPSVRITPGCVARSRLTGTVEKFVGDAVMAVFGAPVAHEDDAERAVRAGLAVLEAIGELNEADPGLSLQVWVGINTGEAVVAVAEPRPPVTFALSWSGGKDSALALWTLRREQLEPEALITTVTEGYARISMHGVRRELLARQAGALRIPLVEVVIPPACVNDVYEARMAQAFGAEPLSGAEAVAFGDLFLEDVRAYREERLAAAGKRGLFPLWGRNTTALAKEFLDAGFEATLVCVDPGALDGDFVGRRYDEQLLAELPPGVDPCGENGEFHTFVHAGPIFAQPIDCEIGRVVERDGFVFCDLVPTQRS